MEVAFEDDYEDYMESELDILFEMFGANTEDELEYALDCWNND